MAVDPSKPRKASRPAGKKAANKAPVGVAEHHAPVEGKADKLRDAGTGVAQRRLIETPKNRNLGRDVEPEHVEHHAMLPVLTDLETSATEELSQLDIDERIEEVTESQVAEELETSVNVFGGAAEAAPGGLRGILHQYKPSVLTGGAPGLPLAVLILVGMLDNFDRQIVGILAPEIKDYFGLGIGPLNTVNGIVTIATLVFALPVGYLVDRVNRTRMAGLGMLILGIFSIAAGFAPTVLVFAVMRFGSGAGKSLEASHFSLLSDYYPPNARAGIFAAKELGNKFANLVGPLVVGTIASLLFFQAALVALAIPALLCAYLCWFLLKEPVRGAQERRIMGADEDVANREERPPSLGEGLRIAWNVRTLRRILYSIPLIVGPLGSILTLQNLFYADEFDLGPGARGVIATLNEPFAIAGILIGGALSARFLRYRPGRLITYGGVMSAVTGLGFGALALSPSLYVAVGFGCIAAFTGAILLPATTTIFSLVTPARARGIAGSLITLAVIPGVLIIIASGFIADDRGIRAGILLFVPVFIVGAFVFASAGVSVDADIRAATAAAMAGEESRRAKAAGKAKLLVVRDLDVKYDQLQILFNVDFDVEEGEIIALLGTNGAGKSTLLRAISGITTPSNGAIFYDGEDITYLPSNEHAARGIIQTPGGRGIFPGLTVAENLKIAGWMFRGDSQYVKEATERVLDFFPSLRNRLDQPAGNLSGGEQQMLTLSQAFMSRPRLLMIDELSLGLAPAIVEQLLGIVRAIAALGTTIILVEQSVNVALTIAEKAVFMEKGEIKFTGSTAELMMRPDILRSVYLKGSSSSGGLIATGKRSSIREGQAETALELRGIKKSWGGVHALNGVDFAVPEGQILGLIGPNGAGKTTIFDVISGFIEPDEGQVLLFGEDVTALSPDQRSKLGLQRSFQDARLFPALTVSENIAVALERHIETRSTTMAALHLPNVSKSEAKLNRRVERLIDLMGIGEFRDKFVRELSTGSRRLVDLACVMAADPKVLLLDEPSSGIAQKEAEELGPLLQRIKYETGCTLLLIEHDMPLIMSVSDELLALEVGTVVTRGLPQDVVEHPQVVASYLGSSEEVINRSGNN